jgi:hypothetical protein
MGSGFGPGAAYRFWWHAVFDHARQCVAKGAKIVLIVPDRKRVLIVAN